MQCFDKRTFTVSVIAIILIIFWLFITLRTNNESECPRSTCPTLSCPPQTCEVCPEPTEIVKTRTIVKTLPPSHPTAYGSTGRDIIRDYDYNSIKGSLLTLQIQFP